MDQRIKSVLQGVRFESKWRTFYTWVNRTRQLVNFALGRRIDVFCLDTSLGQRKKNLSSRSKFKFTVLVNFALGRRIDVFCLDTSLGQRKKNLSSRSKFKFTVHLLRCHFRNS